VTLPELSIRRPVLALVLSLVILLFGGVGIYLLGVREYPAVDPPIVTVTTNYLGAAPEVVDAQITEPIEQTISGIAGIKTMSSTSRDGQSQIQVEFDLDVDMEAAANDVRDKVSQAVRRLPPDADPPVVEKADADSDPIVFLTVRSETKSVIEISNVADTMIKERVQTIPGVSTVRIFGEKRYAMRMWLDADRMAAHGVTPGDVGRAVDAQNVELPSGRVEGRNNELGVRTEGRLERPEQFDRITIRAENGRHIRFGDIGHTELGAQNLRFGLKEDRVPMIGVAVIPQPNTNAIAIADEFNRRLVEIKKDIPPEYQVEIGFDFTTYVRRSVEEVEETLVIAFVLVAAIIFLFLRDWRSTLIPVLAIPVSIVSAFFIMYVAGFSINVLTLVGVVLAIGLVCDDAIVVLENVYSKVEEGMAPLEAAIKGSKEVYFAVISTTITLAAVFLPIVFLEGLVGRLFREFGIVVAGSVLVSAFVSLTLSPMMCRYLLKRHDRPSWFYRVTERFFQALTDGYARSLAVFLRARWLAWPIVAIAVAVLVLVGRKLPGELAPLEDRENIRLNVRAPEGATFEYTQARLDELSDWVRAEIPETRRTFSITAGFGGSVNTGVQNIYLVPPSERQRSQDQIFQQISRASNQFTGLRAFPSQPPTIGNRRGGQPVLFVLQAPNLAALKEVLPTFMERASRAPSLRFVDVDLKVNRPELSVRVDRDRANELDVPVREVARTLQQALGDARLGYFVMNGKQYEVIAQMRREDRDEPSDLGRLFVRSGGGELVPLDSVVEVDEGASPAAIYRYDRYVSATVSAGLAEGKTIGDGIGELRAIAAEVLPQSFSTSLAGQSRDFADSSSSLLFTFAFALLLVYLVLAAQFESFVDPIIIFMTVPLSMTGAVLSLWATGQSLNVFSQIGIIMLVGLVTKNGILVVEFANQRRDEGLPRLEAVLDAARTRFRPILMTSLATILGVLPIALQLGGAAGSRRSLGIAVIGGLVLSGFLTLYVVPAVYTFLSRARRRADAPASLPPQAAPAAAEE
jgi:multidrug efflux pump